MGSSHSLATSLQEQYAAEGTIRQAAQEQGAAEEERQFLESYLGSEDQRLGTGQFENLTADVLPYAERYELDEQYATEMIRTGSMVDSVQNPFINPMLYGKRDGMTAMEYWQDHRDRANDLMSQAEQAARNGDLEGAARLKEEAASIIGGVKHGAHEGYSLVRQGQTAGAVRAASPSGQIIGGLVHEGREFLDPDSATSREYKEGLTEGGERAIAAEMRAFQRQGRDASMASGAGRNLGAERAFAMRGREAAATARANLYQEAGRHFQEYSRSFAADSVKFAREWVTGTAGVRDQFNERIQELRLESSRLQEEASERWWDEFQTDEMYENQKKDARRQTAAKVVKAAVMVVAGALTGGIGAAAGLAAFGGMTATSGAVLGAATAAGNAASDF